MLVAMHQRHGRGCFFSLLLTAFGAAVTACAHRAELPVQAGVGAEPVLPSASPHSLPTVNIAPAAGWRPKETPTPAEGLRCQALCARGSTIRAGSTCCPTATCWSPRPTRRPARGRPRAQGLGHEAGDEARRRRRAQRRPHHLAARRRRRRRRGPRAAFLEGLHSPFGMALVGDDLYVANTDALLRFPYRPGETRITAPGREVTDLPAGPINHHWTKNLVAGPTGGTCTSASAPTATSARTAWPRRRAAPRSGRSTRRPARHRIFASGLRNPVGMAWRAATRRAVGRGQRARRARRRPRSRLHDLGGEGGFYGWPYSYYGRARRPARRAAAPRAGRARRRARLRARSAHRLARADLCRRARPAAALRRAALFVGQHGSWNRGPRSGYKVVFVPFANGRPSGAPRDVLTGFRRPPTATHCGRPVGVAIDRAARCWWRTTSATRSGAFRANR